MGGHLLRTRQWDYRGELASALQAIPTSLTSFAPLPGVALVRLDGQYGDAAGVVQIILAGVYFITRGRGYQLEDASPDPGSARSASNDKREEDEHR